MLIYAVTCRPDVVESSHALNTSDEQWVECQQ